MKKQRLPLDIQFLLESILDESPDEIKLDRDEALRLNNIGAHVPKAKDNSIHWLNDDAYAFFFDTKNDVILYGYNTTHGDMENTLSPAAGKAYLFPYTFTKLYKIYDNEFGHPTFFSYKEKEDRTDYPTISFIGLRASQTDGVTNVAEYLNKNYQFFRHLDIRGIDNVGDVANVLAGRIWTKRHMISFWNKKDTVDDNFKLVEKLIYGLRGDKTKFAYEFLDVRTLFAFKELKGDGGDKEKLSPEEMKKLMAAQHIDPKAKEKLTGDEFKYKHLKKAAKGFDYAARADASVPALEEDLINEDPDDVRVINHSGEEELISSYRDADAAAFMIFPTFSVIKPTGIHSEIKRFLATIYIKFMTGVEVKAHDIPNILNEIDVGDMEVSDIDAMLKDLGGDGVAAKAFKSGIFATSTAYRHKIEKSLSGRLWSDTKILSFWNRKSDVIKNWAEVQKMFKNHSNYGLLDHYHVDFLERTGIETEPLTLAASISRSMGTPPSNDINQLKLVGRFLSNPKNLDKLSDSQMEKLAGKLHVMTPAQKNKVMKAAGMNYNKAAEIADKMGLTVAEFNNLLHISEEKIPTLKEIIGKIEGAR